MLVISAPAAARPAIPNEKTVLRHSVQCFCLTSQALSAQVMANRFLVNLHAIAQACAEDADGFIYAVHANRIERLPL